MIEVAIWLTEFIKENIEADSDFNGVEFHTQIGYEQNNEKPFPQNIVSSLTDSEYEPATVFNAETANRIGFQIMSFSEIISVKGVSMTPMESALFIANKIKRYMQKLKVKQINRNILSIRRVGSTQSMPIDDNGTVYVGINRYEIIAVNDYIE